MDPTPGQVWDPVLPVFAEESSCGEYAVRMFFIFKITFIYPFFLEAAGDGLAPLDVSTQTLSRLHWLNPKTGKPSLQGFGVQD